jgi:Tfp pilus assembly protein PilX
MNVKNTTRKRQPEAGIALLISIFVLLLISVVAIALIVSSGTESALAGNYRNATGVYYAALAGLEEGRGRLLAKNINSFKNTAAGFMPSPGTTLAMANPRYIINPVGSETVAPWDSTNQYYDTQYVAEFGAPPPSSSPSTASLSTVAGIQGPTFKWVRINAVNEVSLKLDVTPYDGVQDANPPIFYDGTNLNTSNNGSQVLEITSLAVLPNGSQKVLQYLAAPVPITLPPFPATLTLAGSPGNVVSFHAPGSNSSYAIKGNDLDCSLPTGNLTGALYPAIGTFTNGNNDINHVISGIPSAYKPNYTGVGSAPDVENVGGSFPANLQTPAQLDALAQSIIQNADVVITPTPSGSPPYLGTATGANLTPLGMSSTNLLTVVVNGNLDISNWSNDGYGLLLVTGTFTYDPDTNWYGIILVIGQGIVGGTHMQFKQINGAMFVAKTRDGNNNVLAGSNLGGASVVFNDSMQGNGMQYSNCWIQKAQPTASYKILSFHEIAQ